MPCYQENFRKEHLDYWTEQNHDASTPRLSYKSSNNTYTSSFWMKKNCRYLRPEPAAGLRPAHSKWMKAIGLKSAYIYANAEISYFWLWDGYDPEVSYNASATDGVSRCGKQLSPDESLHFWRWHQILISGMETVCIQEDIKKKWYETKQYLYSTPFAVSIESVLVHSTLNHSLLQIFFLLSFSVSTRFSLNAVYSSLTAYS